MSFSVHDKKINLEIIKLQEWMQENFGLINVSKEDTLKYLLKLKRDKKEHPEYVPL